MTDADATERGETTPAAPRRRLPLLVAVTVFVLVVDLATKITVVASMADGERIPLLFDGTVSLVLVRNPGAAFSLATGMTWLLTLVAVAVVVGIARFARRLRSPGWAVALGLVLGGALGNLVDRFFRSPGPLRGHVVDFVSVGWWPVFNAADSAICLGGALLVGLALWGVEIDGRLTSRAGDGAERSSTSGLGESLESREAPEPRDAR
ncbi:signal peptidase II [Actinomycetospora termitidis]|uniref:Lipoprotein signal peptidase n=1 Tax=Actinomycetospora termitidis TaxID=3053470 RepID=A0ABT7M9M8_9PSEU|nr:signal peptidase II [Actinomycetospora sp. Odt1-22]MDL5156899.1 signal peptidase II [Actinomycetospora sp. Odt1-22]